MWKIRCRLMPDGVGAFAAFVVLFFMPTIDDAFKLAERHVKEARRLVAEQLAQVDRLRDLGCDTGDARHVLQIFIATLKIFEEHWDRLKAAKFGDYLSSPAGGKEGRDPQESSNELDVAMKLEPS